MFFELCGVAQLPDGLMNPFLEKKNKKMSWEDRSGNTFYDARRNLIPITWFESFMM